MWDLKLIELGGLSYLLGIDIGMWDPKLIELGGHFKGKHYKIINMKWLGPAWKETAQ